MPSTSRDPEPEFMDAPPPVLAAEVAELTRVALRDRWGLALIAVGWSNLLILLACQWLYSTGDRAASHVLPLWGLDLAALVAILRRFIVRPDRSPPALTIVIVRIWVTFLILTFSTASLNSLVGFETDWFKAVWSTLSTFGFATMAWLLNLAFLIPAVQMSLTSLLIARNPDHAYAIYGLSWCLALNGLGLALELRRARGLVRATPSRRAKPRAVEASFGLRISEFRPDRPESSF